MTTAPRHQPTDPLWRRYWSSLRWWVRGVTGADAYATTSNGVVTPIMSRCRRRRSGVTSPIVRTAILKRVAAERRWPEPVDLCRPALEHLEKRPLVANNYS